MDGTNYDLSDLAAVTNGKNGWGDNSVLWFVLLLFMMGGFGAWGGNRAPAGPAPVTEAQLTNGLNNNMTQQQLQNIAMSSERNNYETAQLVNGQTNTMLQMHSADQVNMLQGFNQLNTAIMGQTNQLASKLDNLASHMDECCCSIKTQMLQDKYERAQFELTEARNNISNYNQSQYLLNQMGRYVPYAGSGTSTGSGAEVAIK